MKRYVTPENLKNYYLDICSCIKNCIEHQWSLEINIYIIYVLKHSPELIYVQIKINSNSKYLAPLH